MFSKTIWPAIGVWAVGVGWLADAPVIRADERKVRITVAAILATDRNNTVDPKLARIAREIQKTDPQLTGFVLAQTTRKSLPVGGNFQFPLVDQEVVDIVVDKGVDQQNMVSLKLKPPQLGEIVYMTACDKFFPIVTRYQTKDKDRLIIAIMVRPSRH